MSEPQGPPESIYSSPEDFQAWLAEVRTRREARARSRALHEHWVRSLEQLREEIAAASAADDQEIAAELGGVAARFEALRSGTVELDAVAVQASASRTVATAGPAQPAQQAPLPRRDPAEEAAAQEALKSALQDRLAAVRERVASLRAARPPGGDMPLATQHAFRLRAAAAQLGAVCSEATRGRVDASLSGETGAICDWLDIERDLVGDCDACSLFERDALRLACAMVPPGGWVALAALYDQTADALPVLDWTQANVERISSEAALRMLNAVGAVQQLLYRRLTEYNLTDRLQVDLYGRIKDLGKTVGFVRALSPHNSEEELKALADSLMPAYEDLRRSAEEEWARQEKAARRAAAVSAVLDLVRARPALGQDPRSLDADRNELFPLLDSCFDAGVPPTNKEIRDALLATGDRLLTDVPRFARLLEAIAEERARRDAESAPAAREPERTDPTLETYRAAVKPFAEGKRLMILGGTPRNRVCEELREMLGFTEVVWPASKKSDRCTKFEHEVKRSDILILLKNFAGHDMSEKGREWIRAVGGHFLLLPSGYGVAQILHQLYQYVSSENGREPRPAAPSANGAEP